jgi:hypothetical protein
MLQNSWVYAAWFRNPDVPPDDQDYDWVAVIVIKADSPEKAKQWGDHLALRGCAAANCRNQFLWSEVHEKSDTPIVEYGLVPSESVLGL